jgi:outer membrane biosynthesis protein TonB
LAWLLNQGRNNKINKMATAVKSKNIISDLVDRIRDKSLENPHITKSLLLHFVILLVLSGMLPTCARKIEAPRIIAVDILPLGADQRTTPKAAQQVKKVEPKKDIPKPLPPKQVKKPVEATKMEKAEKPKAAAKPPEKPSLKKVEKKPEPIKKPQEEQKKDTREQEGKKKLLKDLEKKDQAALEDIFEDAAKTEPKPASQPAQNSGKSDVIDPAFINELMGKIQSQISQCWNIPIGAKDVQNMQVRLFIALSPAGDVMQVRIVDQIMYSADNAYRVVADSAVWAVKECSPLQGLPADKYDLWKEIEFTFDPSLAL